MTTAELAIKMDPETTTLAEMHQILDELRYYGHSMNMAYTLNGRIICDDVVDQGVAGMIEIFDRCGYWPYIRVYDADHPVPSEDECKAKLRDLYRELGGVYDYHALWNWIKSVVYEEGKE